MAVHRLERPGMSREERIGLAIAIAAHVGLVAWLALAPSRSTFQPPPDRMTVSLSDAVAPEATSPEPLAQAAPETAPTLGEAAPEPEPLPEVAPPVPQPRVIASPLPRLAPPVAKPAARPSAKPSAKPAVAPQADSRTRRRPDAPAGASRVGKNFLKGIPGGEARGAAQNPPAARAGPQVTASLRQAIARQLVPQWKAPQGVEVEKITTYLSWDLNRDGSLAGPPRVVRQEGITDANRAQAARHAEQAIRAVQLAAPFDLPIAYYEIWRKIRNSPFDRNLLQ